MIELITGISILASTVSFQFNAAGFASSTASTTENTASTTLNEQAKSYRAEVREYFKNDPILVDIARCESTYRQFDKDGSVIRGKVNPKDVGIMQINERYHLERSKELGYDIYTVEGNLGYAKRMYEDQGAAPWSASQRCWGGKEVAINK